MFLNVYSPYNAKGFQLELITPDEDRIIKVLPHDVLIYEIEQLRKSAAPQNMVAFSTLSDQEKIAYCQSDMYYLDSDIYMDVGDKFYHYEKDGTIKIFPSGSNAYYRVMGDKIPDVDKQAFEDAKIQNQKNPVRKLVPNQLRSSFDTLVDKSKISKYALCIMGLRKFLMAQQAPLDHNSQLPSLEYRGDEHLPPKGTYCECKKCDLVLSFNRMILEFDPVWTAKQCTGKGEFSKDFGI